MALCHGTYGKELFHSIKRAGLHAKHELGLIKWPVLITNRVALAIAGLSVRIETISVLGPLDILCNIGGSLQIQLA